MPRRRRGVTLVDLQHLLEDLRDAYPGAVEETILTELVANSLDAGAGHIRFELDPAASTITAVDDGTGMTWKQLREFHNLATSTKTRGEGIGFAGVGVKLALLVCREVVTESRRGSSHDATRWRLASRHEAPWERITPPVLVAERGTAVRLNVENPLSPLLDAGYVETTLRTHYQPLLDPAFDGQLREFYPRSVRFSINGAALRPQASGADEMEPLAVRIGRQRKPSGTGYLSRSVSPLAENRRGLAISTYGKVIRQGWDWLGVFPHDPTRIAGIVEVPALAACLTLNKGDFVRTGTRGATFLAYRRALQEAVQRQLTLWGDAANVAEESRRRAARPVERDLERVLLDLADAFPLIASLVEQRLGGQKKIPLMGSGGGRPAPHDASATNGAAADAGAGNLTAPTSEATDAGTEPAVATLAPPDPQGAGTGGVPDPAKTEPRRAGRYGLAIEYEDRPESLELGRLAETTVYVNASHPAYRRAEQSGSTGYHLALAVALALAPLAVGSVGEHGFVTAFLAKWGEATRPTRRRRG